MQLTFPISSENLMQSRLGELGSQSIDFGQTLAQKLLFVENVSITYNEDILIVSRIN